MSEYSTIGSNADDAVATEVTTGSRPLRIGEVATIAGVSQRTIHHYEEMGLVTPLLREGTSHRMYDGSIIPRLKRIAVLKELGLALEEIGSVIDLYFTDDVGSGLAAKRKVVAILEGHLADADARLAAVSAFRDDLLQSIARMRAYILVAEERQGSEGDARPSTTA